MKKWNFAVRRFLRRFHLADLLLLTFMVVLLLQSGHNLFVNELAQGDSSQLDVVIRTTAAAIFGYFVSAGVLSTSVSTVSGTRNPIGFSPSQVESGSARMEGSVSTGGGEALPDAPALSQGAVEKGAVRQQMIIVGAIGLAALGMLILARNCGRTSPEALATLSQLRDFVSGSVGFLIGHGSGKENIQQ